ncbi:hypothetical protein R1sor_003172 [Riccia sorocarpa]|uniref:Uncharacterized protein n=1 Tax=Riccia sorocarpa TaxID=122646 RepID=A0ABD3H492_9MARC
MDRPPSKQRKLSRPTSSEATGSKGKRPSSSGSTSGRRPTTYEVPNPRKGKKRAPPDAEEKGITPSVLSQRPPTPVPYDHFEQELGNDPASVCNAPNYNPADPSNHPSQNCEHVPRKSMGGSRRTSRPSTSSRPVSIGSRPSTSARIPNPVALGAPIFRPGSPVFNPPKVFSPYQMQFAPVFVTGMDEHEIGINDPEERSCNPSEYMDWEFVGDSWASAAEITPDVYYFDPYDGGSYPPKAEDMLIFPPRGKRKYKLVELDTDEDLQLQPETDVQPLEDHPEPFDVQPRAVDKPPGKDGKRTKLTLPLDLFDNSDMDLLHPSKILEEHGNRGIRARSRYYSNDGKASWRPCEVLSWDKASDTYVVEWLSPSGLPTGKTKTIGRLNLLFDHESEGNFVARLIAAKELRKRVETQMRYSRFLGTLPFVNPEGVDDNLLLRLMTRVGRNLSLTYSEVVKTFLEELKFDYHNAVNKAVLDFKFAVADEEEHAHFSGLQIFPGPESVAPAPKEGCVPVPYSPYTPFSSRRERTVVNLVVAEECFLMVLQLFYKDMDVSTTLLVNPQIFSLPRPFGVDDFRLMQDEYTRDIADSFRSIWIMRVLGLIDEVVPHGSSLLNAPKQRLLALVSRLSLIMSEQLQDIVLNSIRVFKRIWTDYFLVRESKDEEPKPLPIGVRKEPLFRIKLSLEMDHFEFLPKLEVIESTIQALLEGIVESVKGMDDLQTRLTDIFKHYHPKEMTTINLDDTAVSSAWEVTQDILQQSFVQPRCLLDRFMVFNDLAAIDVLKHVTEFKAGSYSLERYEEEITLYQEVADAALRSSERETSFELFVVNCESLCNDLSSKARSIADLLLTQIMEATTIKSGETRKKYEVIEAVLLGYGTN